MMTLTGAVLQEPQREAASVPVDDAQPRCALSGEKFEKFWHDKHQVCSSAIVARTFAKPLSEAD